MNESTLREMWYTYVSNIAPYYSPKKDNAKDYKSYLDFMLIKAKEHKDVLSSQLKVKVPMPSPEKYFEYVKANLRSILIARISSSYPFNKNILTEYNLPDILKSYVSYTLEQRENEVKEKIRDFDSLTVEEFAQNGLLDTRTVDGRRYDKGMKVSKFLSRIGFSDSDYANVKFDYTSYKDHYVALSIDPADFGDAGAKGESCYSPHGSNRHALVATIRYDQSMVATTYDPMTKSYWRAWVYADHAKKLVFIASGHPYENQLYQIALYTYFIERGYKIAKRVRTDLNTYLDSNYSDSVKALFSQHAADEAIELTTDLTDGKNPYIGIPDFKRDGGYGIVRRDGIEDTDDDYIEDDEEVEEEDE